MADAPDGEFFLREALGTLREPCEEDAGLRGCCGTPQLGPHANDCPKPPALREGMLDHERMYWHETEARDG